MNPGLNYLALGDSYTVGEGVTPGAGFPYQLVTRLMQQGIQVHSPLILAKTGWTTADLLLAIKAARLPASPQLVTLLIGVNDQYQGLDTGDYLDRFKELLMLSTELAGGITSHVVVLSIPDWSVTPFAAGRDRTMIAAEIAIFNTLNRRETERAGIHYLDITTDSRKAGADTSLRVPDGLHPSAKLYTLWTERLLPLARKIFEEI